MNGKVQELESCAQSGADHRSLAERMRALIY